jgi:hypothetical protein
MENKIWVLKKSGFAGLYWEVAASHSLTKLVESTGLKLTDFHETSQGYWECRDHRDSDTPKSYVHLIITQVPVLT